MASPAMLPISNPQTESKPSIAIPAFRSFISRLSSTIRNSLAQRRPWLELIGRTSFSCPDSVSDAASHIRKNFSDFRINYVALLAASLTLSLLSHPFPLLVLLSLLAAWLFLYLFRPSDQLLVIGGRTFVDQEILGILVVSMIVVMFLTSIGAFRMPEDLTCCCLRARSLQDA